MYNQSRYTLDIPDLPNHGIEIISFDSKQYSLDYNNTASQNYCFNINCYNAKSYLLKQLINKNITLIIYDNSNKVYFHGIITHCTDHQIPQIADQITVCSPLYLLTLNIQHKVYHNVTLADLIDQILMNAGWQKYQYQLMLENTYPQREYVVQYQESDFDFLQRKCAFYGVFFTFIQLAERPILIFCDNIQKLSEKIDNRSLNFYSGSGQVHGTNSVFNVEWHEQMVTDNIRLNDYNYRTPDISLLLESVPTHITMSPFMTDYRFQDHYKTLEEGQFLLSIRQQALDCRRKIWIAKTDCALLQPGYLLQINNHPINDMNGLFTIITITHYGDQSTAFTMDSDIKHSSIHPYYNIIELIPASLPYRPTAPEPVYQENCLANITGTPSDYADIDEHGRYFIKPKFDCSDDSEKQTSHAVRLVQPLSGNQYGAHFPLHVGTEVFLTHMNGDPDRPIIMGVLPNMNSISPVTTNNYTQNIIKTCGGNQILLDDQLGHEHILFSTPEHQHTVLLDATTGQPQINIKSSQGDISFQATGNINSNSQHDYQQIIGNNHEVSVQNLAQIRTDKGDISLKSGKDILLNAMNNMTQSTKNGDIILQSGQNMMINAQQDINLIINNSDLTIKTNCGNILFQAEQNILLESTGELEHIYLAQGGASIQITADAITLTSPKAINFSAEQINIMGNINYGEKNNNATIDNLILNYKDEVGEQLNNLEGIYHLLTENLI